MQSVSAGPSLSYPSLLARGEHSVAAAQGRALPVGPVEPQRGIPQGFERSTYIQANVVAFKQSVSNGKALEFVKSLIEHSPLDPSAIAGAERLFERTITAALPLASDPHSVGLNMLATAALVDDHRDCARQLHGHLDDFSARRTATAVAWVTDDQGSSRSVGSSSDTVPKRQRDALDDMDISTPVHLAGDILRRGGHPIKGHAEESIWKHAEEHHFSVFSPPTPQIPMCLLCEGRLLANNMTERMALNDLEIAMTRSISGVRDRNFITGSDQARADNTNLRALTDGHPSHFSVDDVSALVALAVDDTAGGRQRAAIDILQGILNQST